LCWLEPEFKFKNELIVFYLFYLCGSGESCV
jgi:hypothetical protein